MSNENNKGFNSFLLILNIIITCVCALFVIWILVNEATNATGAIGAIIFGIITPVLSWQYYFEHKSACIISIQKSNGVGLTGVKYNIKSMNSDVSHNNKSHVDYTNNDIANEPLVQEFQNYLNDENYLKALETVNTIILRYPAWGLAYVDRANTIYRCIANDLVSHDRWEDIIIDLKKASELGNDKDFICKNLANLMLPVQFINDFSGESSRDFVAEHDLLYKNFPEFAMEILTTTHDENNLNDIQSTINIISNIINNISRGGSFLYAIRAYDYSLLDAVTYSEQIQRDLKESSNREPDSLFTSFVRCHYIVRWFSKITDNYSIEGEDLPLINSNLINDIKSDFVKICNSKNEKFIAIVEIIKPFFLRFANNYASAVMSKATLFFMLEEMVKNSNMDINTFISVCQGENFSSKDQDFDKKIQTILRCKEYAQIAYSLDENNPLSCFALGFTKLFLNEKKEGLELMGKSIELDPNSARYKLRALIYQKLEQYNDAIRDFSDALSLCTDETEKKEILELIEKMNEMKKKQKDQAARINTERKGRELDI